MTRPAHDAAAALPWLERERTTDMRTFTAHRLTSGALLTSALMLGCTAESEPTHGELIAYAESVYDNYEAAAGGRIALDVVTLQTGALSDLGGGDLGELLGVPGTWIRMEQRGTEITAVERETRDPVQDEWGQAVDLRDFENTGRALAEGSYRLLAVTATVAGAPATHHALEACWARTGHCIVMDPVLLQADGFLHQRRRLLAEGWAPIERFAFEPEDGKQQPLGATAAAACTLNSNPTKTLVSITFPAYAIEYRNIFGIVLVRKDMGSQQAGVTCFVNGAGQCVSSGFGFSTASSCFSNLGYTCDCDNTGNQIGTSSDGAATRSWSEARCTHRAFLSAAVSWSIEGVGSSFNIQWDTAGSVDSNGGQIFDSCSFH
jgi:hypothetical protein